MVWSLLLVVVVMGGPAWLGAAGHGEHHGAWFCWLQLEVEWVACREKVVFVAMVALVNVGSRVLLASRAARTVGAVRWW